MNDEELLDRLASMSENTDLAPGDQEACITAARIIMRKKQSKAELQNALRELGWKVGSL